MKKIIYLLLMLVVTGIQSRAQTLTLPKIYFPFTSDTWSVGPTKFATKRSPLFLSAVPDNGAGGVLGSNRFGQSHGFGFVSSGQVLYNRMQIMDASGTQGPSSFFGTNSATGHDLDKFTISCWIYVDPSENERRYLFYGTTSSHQLGFGLSIQGADLYLVKYINNGTADIGQKLSLAVVGNSWEAKFWGPATFSAGAGWYQVILVQAPFYTRVFVGTRPSTGTTGGTGVKGKFDQAFTSSMVMHGKQDLTSFVNWGIGAPDGNTTVKPVQSVDDFMLFDYDMTEAQAEALYNCQVAGDAGDCLVAAPLYDQKFALIGDYGCDGGISTTPALTNPEGSVAGMVKSWSPDYIVSVGDDSYGNAVSRGCSIHLDDNIGKYYHDYIYPYTGSYGAGSPNSTSRFFPTQGNHDRDCPGGVVTTCSSNGTPIPSYFRCSCIWETYFALQQYPPGNGRYYTYTKGNIQFFSLNSNKEEPDGNAYNSVQATWLKNALAASTATFKVVVVHHPPYASKIIPHGGNAPQDSLSKWPFKDWGADIVLAGDDHFYERNDSANLTYVINGVGGFPGLANAPTLVAGNRIHIEQEFGAMRVESNDNSIHFQFYSIDPLHPDDRTSDRLRDEFYLYKRPNGTTYAAERPRLLTDSANVFTVVDDEATGLVAHPNPTDGQLLVRVKAGVDGKALFRLIDLSGRTLFIQQNMMTKGIQEIDLGNLRSKGAIAGMYMLEVTMEGKKQIIKILVK